MMGLHSANNYISRSIILVEQMLHLQINFIHSRLNSTDWVNLPAGSIQSTEFVSN